MDSNSQINDDDEYLNNILKIVFENKIKKVKDPFEIDQTELYRGIDKCLCLIESHNKCNQNVSNAHILLENIEKW